MARANAFWPTAVVGEADSVNSVLASACYIGGPKGVSPGQKALLHGTHFLRDVSPVFPYSTVRQTTVMLFDAFADTEGGGLRNLKDCPKVSA